MRMMKPVAKATSIAMVVLVCSASAQAAIDWTFRYEGDVMPTTAGSIAFSDATTSKFNDLGALVSTDGNILNFAPQNNGVGRIDHRVKFPSTTGASLLLDSTTGYTVEFRARLNSVDEARSGQASVMIPDGVTGNVHFLHLFDADMDPANGYSVNLSSTTNDIVSVSAGFNTFRLTVLGNIANLYIGENPVPAATDTTGGRALNLNALRVGDFTGSADADWDLDYLYLFDGGAVAAIPEPASMSLLGLGAGLILLRRRSVGTK